MLLVSIALVATGTYRLWQEGPWDLPKPGKGKNPSVVEEPKRKPPQPQLVSAKNIIEKNLFDPERGAGRTQEAEASTVAMQRIRSMILLGTAILGNSRYAILQQPSDSRPPASRGQTVPPSQLRLKLGDTVEGFKLSEIQEKRVVFTKGTSRVEVALDFFRKVEETKQKTAAPTPARPAAARRVESTTPAKGEMAAPTPPKPNKVTTVEGTGKTPRKERQGQQRPGQVPSLGVPPSEEAAPPGTP